MSISHYVESSLLGLLIHILIVVSISVRVIMKRPATGVALAWLFLVAVLPLVGAVLYLMIGERKITPTRVERLASLKHQHHKVIDAIATSDLTRVNWSMNPPAAERMDRLGRKLVGGVTFSGSRLRLISNPQQILETLAAEIDRASVSVLMEFYIWNAGGLADKVSDSLQAAAKRGVDCRVLVDAVGAKSWYRGKQRKALEKSGVRIKQALPVSVFRTFVGRYDLRLHRKIVVIDGRKAWTGSMNLVDPRYFKQDAGVGEWVDAMVEIKGAAVVPLASTLIGDWSLETGESVEDMARMFGLEQVIPEGTADIQVISSGPGESGDALLQMTLALIHAAEHELILTTPYLVPDDSLRAALRGACGRGVNVRIVVPEVVDSFMTRHACRSYYDGLIDTGAEFFLFRNGLLHTKSIMVDGAMAMFGTANFDMRSLWLNYEVSLFVYDHDFAGRLRELQNQYIAQSIALDPVPWRQRSFGRRFLENAARLASSLL